MCGRCRKGFADNAERHEGDILRATSPLGHWIAACACGWCPDVTYPSAGEAATAVGRHVLDHNRQETTP